VKISFSDNALVARGLDRIVAAAAVLAELPVDRVVNAQAASDAVASALETILPAGHERSFELEIGERRVELAILGLEAAQLDRFNEAAGLPELGNVLDRLARVERRDGRIVVELV
jgi:hypothetical protein